MKKLKKSIVWLLSVMTVLAVAVFAYLQLPVFGAAPSGERLARIQASPNYKDGRFQNISHTPTITSDKSVFQATKDFLFHGNKNVRPSTPVPAVKTDLHSLPEDQNWYVWLGHSSYLMQIDGKRFLFDPVFVSISPLPFGGKPFWGTDIYQAADMPAVDYLVITHDHYDHLEYPTVKALRERVGKVITPLGVGAHLERWGYAPQDIVELDWQEAADLAEGFTITALPARHASGRALSPDNTLWASFMLQTPGETVYIGGDSGYDGFFKDIARQFPHITLAILDNGQYDTDWAYVHFLPDDLIRAIQDLKPHTVLPVHNSKYELAVHDWNEPLKLFSEKAAHANIRFAAPKIGEVWDVTAKPLTTEKWWE